MNWVQAFPYDLGEYVAEKGVDPFLGKRKWQQQPLHRCCGVGLAEVDRHRQEKPGWWGVEGQELGEDSGGQSLGGHC